MVRVGIGDSRWSRVSNPSSQLSIPHCGLEPQSTENRLCHSGIGPQRVPAPVSPILKVSDYLFTFLSDLNVPFDNNASERA